MTKQNSIGAATTTPSPERDSRLDRLLTLADGVFAIALTLLAVELTLPEAAADLHGQGQSAGRRRGSAETEKSPGLAWEAGAPLATTKSSARF